MYIYTHFECCLKSEAGTFKLGPCLVDPSGVWRLWATPSAITTGRYIFWPL